MEESFLEEQRRVGTFDSEGDFTLSGAAVKKMGAFNLPNESYWLLKLVQAAVASGAAEIGFKQDGQCTCAVFVVSREFRVEDILNGLSRAEPVEDRALNHLLQALRAVGPGQERRFELSIYSDSYLYRANWRGDELHIPEPIQSNVARDRQRIAIEVWGGSPRRYADEQETLIAGVRACPIPVYLDARLVNNLSYPADTLVGQLSHAYLAVGSVSYSEGRFVGLPRPVSLDRKFPRTRISDRFTDDRPLLSFLESSETLDFFWQLEFGFKIICWGNHAGQEFEFDCPERRSTMNWVVDGVICSTESWGEPAAVCLNLFADASDLATDLSGFQFQDKNQKLREKRIRAARTVTDPMVKKSLAVVRSRFPKPFARELLARAAFLTFPSLILPPPLNLVSLGMLGFTTLHSVRKKYSLLKACQEHLETYWRKL